MTATPSGSHRAAAFLLSLEKEDAARVMRHLDPKVVAHVAEAMTELDPSVCDAEAVDGLYQELARSLYHRASVRPQDDFELREILERTFGAADATEVLQGIHDRRRKEQPFAFLESYPAEVVARVLSDEAPSVVALILAHISPGVSAAVLGVIEEERALAVVKRMTAISPPGIETMLAIADDLEERIRHAATIPAPPDLADTLRSVADLLNFSKTETERAVLEGLEEENEEIAHQVREFMFTWEDLATIEKRAMQKILASVDTRTLSMALKGSSEGVEGNIMANLSSRVREMVADERELLGLVPMAEVVQARNEIMLAVRALMDSGEFSPTRAGEELVS